MNEPTNPTNPESNRPQSPPPLIPSSTGVSLGGSASPSAILESLLKRPAQLIVALQEASSLRFAFILGAAAVFILALYGLVVGSFSGGTQLIAAPLKVSLGALASALICLPSFFIFACLTGADVTFRQIVGILAATLALAALLLIGFAPVAWVFSQSTESVAFIAALHLVFWWIALGFGLRLLRIFMNVARVTDRIHLKVWASIFVLVTLQMTTSLRPLVGTASTILPREKKFFIVHWVETLSTDSH